MAVRFLKGPASCSGEPTAISRCALNGYLRVKRIFAPHLLLIELDRQIVRRAYCQAAILLNSTGPPVVRIDTQASVQRGEHDRRQAIDPIAPSRSSDGLLTPAGSLDRPVPVRRNRAPVSARGAEQGPCRVQSRAVSDRAQEDDAGVGRIFRRPASWRKGGGAKGSPSLIYGLEIWITRSFSTAIPTMVRAAKAAGTHDWHQGPRKAGSVTLSAAIPTNESGSTSQHRS